MAGVVAGNGAANLATGIRHAGTGRNWISLVLWVTYNWPGITCTGLAISLPLNYFHFYYSTVLCCSVVYWGGGGGCYAGMIITCGHSIIATNWDSITHCMQHSDPSEQPSFRLSCIQTSPTPTPTSTPLYSMQSEWVYHNLVSLLILPWPFTSTYAHSTRHESYTSWSAAWQVSGHNQSTYTTLN